MGSQDESIQEPKGAPLVQPLVREGSLYNLTLDEVQNQLGNLGKPLGSMNLDELLKNLWSAEAGDFGGDENNMQQFVELVSGSSLNPQGSLTLFGDLCKKTVDEVWRDMQTKKGGDRDKEAKERQATLGEMTLEDFLVKAGVVTDSFHTKDDGGAISGIDSNVASGKNVSQHDHWIQYQQQQHQNQQDGMMVGFVAGNVIQQPFQVAANPILDAAYSETMMKMSPSSLIGTQTLGRKRVASDNVVVEKTVERRQKRMIKNRESAARSRARKQAYTQELEIKVSRLEEENERLRRQCEIEMILPCAPPPDPKHQLRRTGSATF
ncbi:hypothetical protein TanjilG_05227 [Lupinus angustifolius]|uniref:BZIP domain-containing protein n=1 Tax=Lupinus angustifolius TaxID=3871 RepID=A0A4P1RAQ4_LUPAN|nr:PREDICTED: ABSCISIC ACID-INSENSITIVE 5-like protein 2 [Lupinus angustifolius]OIW06456.1 hypothetical protein TanjilG_05227 [Lupinus angustifolius]